MPRRPRHRALQIRTVPSASWAQSGRQHRSLQFQIPSRTEVQHLDVLARARFRSADARDGCRGALVIPSWEMRVLMVLDADRRRSATCSTSMSAVSDRAPCASRRHCRESDAHHAACEARFRRESRPRAAHAAARAQGDPRARASREAFADPTVPRNPDVPRHRAAPGTTAPLIDRRASGGAPCNG